MSQMKVLIADDHPIILDSLVSLVDGQDRYKVVAIARNGSQVIKALGNNNIEMAILDLNMPEMNGLDCMEVIHEKYPDLKVLFLTIYQEEYVIKRLINLGVKGFLFKNTSPDKIVQVMDTLMMGGEYFEDVKTFVKPKKNFGFQEEHHLTPREKEIIKLLADGHSSTSISEKLFISEMTVQTHRKNILKKLNFTNTAQLVAFAKSSGIL